jgi:hypothetical protein
MKRVILGIFFFSTLAQAINLDEIINTSLAKNPSLESINERIAANKQNIKVSDQFSNPQLLITKNTLPADQAMSKSTFTVKQKNSFLQQTRNKQKNCTRTRGAFKRKITCCKSKTC